MSIQLKIQCACLSFLMVLGVLGGLAELQVVRMGRLATGIYDHAFMGMSYVDQAQQDYLRAFAKHASAGPDAGGAAIREDLDSVLDKLDVALERASSDRTRVAGAATRAAISGLRDLPTLEMTRQFQAADAAMSQLVARFQADGLLKRDDAESLAQLGWTILLAELAAASVVMAVMGWLVGRSLSRPMTAVVRVIRGLTAGDLGETLPDRLLARRDEIGEIARATALFSDALRSNEQAVLEQAALRGQVAAERATLLSRAAALIERDSAEAGQRAAECSAMLTVHADDLAASATRVLASVAEVSLGASDALSGSELVAAAGEELSLTAQNVAGRMGKAAQEASDTVQAGAQARLVIDRLSDATAEISSFATLIDTIATRTKLLSFNAAIEAARSGAAGLGFAVVANEVKNLAMQTALSTQDIRRRAQDIQSATHAAAAALDEMVGRAGAIESITQAVAAAAEQQMIATDEIAGNVAASAATLRAVARQVVTVSQEAHDTAVAVTKLREISGEVQGVVRNLHGVVMRTLSRSPDAAIL